MGARATVWEGHRHIFQKPDIFLTNIQPPWFASTRARMMLICTVVCGVVLFSLSGHVQWRWVVASAFWWAWATAAAPTWCGDSAGLFHHRWDASDH